MTNQQVLLGLDIGTTGIKAIAFDLRGREVAKAIRSTPTRHYPNGHADYDAEELWAVCVSVLKDVGTVLQAAEATPLALSCTSMAESGVLLDAHGEATYPVIPWFDYRTAPQVEWWKQHVGFDETAAVCGTVPHPMFGMPKLMWIRDNEPVAYAAGRHWLNLADYADFRLCGAMATDFSLASRTLVLDLVNQRWSADLLDAIDIRADLLADLVGAGTPIGTLLPDIASACGLPVGLPIVRGGQDHVCAALATGIAGPGMILDSIGTAEAFFLARNEPDMSGRLWPDELNQGVHVVPGLTYVMTGTGEGAGRIDAHRSELGVTFEEYLAAARHRGAERDMIESLAVDGQRLFERMVWASGAAEVRHLVTGGGARISLLMQRKREIGGRPIELPAIDEATCLGAALLAGAGIGVYPSIAAAPTELEQTELSRPPGT